jgi:sugar (pentulose or hexulose) kinase
VSDLLLGIDVGTSACKAAVVDAEGAERAHGQAETPWRRVPTGAEIDPHALLDAALAAARAALADAPEGRVRGIGVTGMAETGVLLDGRGVPVAPAIAWYDARGGDEARALGDDLGAERFTRTTGLPVSALCTAPKLRWLVEHRPAVRAARRWLNVGEWIVRGLGGDEVAELSLSSRTGLLDLAAKAPFADALAWTGLRDDLLPDFILAGTPAGTAGDALPGARGAVLTVAGHDHLCAAVGAGAVRPGDLLDSCGTAEALVRAVQPPLPEGVVEAAVGVGLTVGWHVLWQRWALLGGFESGKLLQDLDLESEGGLAEVRRLANRAAELRQAIERIAGPSSRLIVTGGWSQHPVVAAVKLEVLGKFERPPHAEAGARGAAVLGGVASRVRATESV